MSAPHTGQRLRVGVVFHGTTVWISELFSIVFVWVLLAGLALLSSLIFLNEMRIGGHEKTLSRMQSEHLSLEHRITILREKRRVAVALSGIAGQRIDSVLQERLVELVHTSSRQYGYDPLLVLAVIYVESIFDPEARGRYRSGEESGALGLM